jgi:hypothetical protein
MNAGVRPRRERTRRHIHTKSDQPRSCRRGCVAALRGARRARETHALAGGRIASRSGARNGCGGGHRALLRPHAGLHVRSSARRDHNHSRTGARATSPHAFYRCPMVGPRRRATRAARRPSGTTHGLLERSDGGVTADGRRCAPHAAGRAAAACLVGAPRPMPCRCPSPLAPTAGLAASKSRPKERSLLFQGVGFAQVQNGDGCEGQHPRCVFAGHVVLNCAKEQGRGIRQGGHGRGGGRAQAIGPTAEHGVGGRVRTVSWKRPDQKVGVWSDRMDRQGLVQLPRISEAAPPCQKGRASRVEDKCACVTSLPACGRLTP